MHNGVLRAKEQPAFGSDTTSRRDELCLGAVAS
jgi:hypothetical protein